MCVSQLGEASGAKRVGKKRKLLCVSCIFKRRQGHRRIYRQRGGSAPFCECPRPHQRQAPVISHSPTDHPSSHIAHSSLPPHENVESDSVGRRSHSRVQEFEPSYRIVPVTTAVDDSVVRVNIQPN